MYGPEAVVVVEQPAVFQRPRYPSEERSVLVEGVNSKPEIKTWPSIKVTNYDGVLKVIVSCVEEHRPYRFHRYQFVGSRCLAGIFNSADFTTNSAEPTILTFDQLNIQKIPKRDFQNMLDQRKKKNIDPFELSGEPDDLRREMNTLRLCFQVVLRTDPDNPLFEVLMPPILSEPFTFRPWLKIVAVKKSAIFKFFVDGYSKLKLRNKFSQLLFIYRIIFWLYECIQQTY